MIIEITKGKRSGRIAKVKCDNCEKEFTLLLSQDKSKNQYCSWECYSEGRQTGKYIHCKKCGKEIYRANYRLIRDKDSFCSSKCAHQYLIKEYIHCDNCGKEIHIVESKIRKNNFCSYKCRGEFTKAKTPKAKLKCGYCQEYFYRNNNTYLRDIRRKTNKIFCSKNCHLDYLKAQIDVIKNKLNKHISNLIRLALRGNKNGKHWEELLGYNIQDLISCLERQFKPGMTWENWSKYGWHIDHIQPIASFNFNSYEDIEFKQCWVLSNLQPLWWWENLSKGKKIDYKGNFCDKDL